MVELGCAFCEVANALLANAFGDGHGDDGVGDGDGVAVALAMVTMIAMVVVWC